MIDLDGFENDVVLHGYFIDSDGTCKIAQLWYDKYSDNPCEIDDEYGKVVVPKKYGFGNTDFYFDASDQKSAATELGLGEGILTNGVIDIGKCHEKGIAILPFRIDKLEFDRIGLSPAESFDAGENMGFMFVAEEVWKGELGFDSIMCVEENFKWKLKWLQAFCNGETYELTISEIVEKGKACNEDMMTVTESGDSICIRNVDRYSDIYLIEYSGSDAEILIRILRDNGYGPPDDKVYLDWETMRSVVVQKETN